MKNGTFGYLFGTRESGHSPASWSSQFAAVGSLYSERQEGVLERSIRREIADVLGFEPDEPPHQLPSCGFHETDTEFFAWTPPSAHSRKGNGHRSGPEHRACRDCGLLGHLPSRCLQKKAA